MTAAAAHTGRVGQGHLGWTAAGSHYRPILLNRATVCALIGLSTSGLYRLMTAGLFPPQVIYRLLKIRRWRREDIDNC